VPVVSHVSGVAASTHDCAFGVHDPTQLPFEQAWSTQGAPMFCHAPLLHSAGCCPAKHPIAPSVQTVVHAPAAHVSDAEHATVPMQLDSLPSSRHETAPVAQRVPDGFVPSADTLHASGWPG
jgi:hypothetical protein